MGSRSRDDGFTLIEVIVAATLLLVGVLAAVSLLDLANTQTAGAKARNQANNLTRRIIEVARTVTLGNLDQAGGPAQIQAQAPELADSDAGGAGWTIERGGLTYTVEWASCLVDDPADGTSSPAARTAEYCAQPAASATPDTAPSDARRATVTLRWRSGGQTRSVRSVAVLPLGVGDLPIVDDVSLVSPAACSGPCTITADAVRFRAQTLTNASSMTWLVDGAVAATCPPAGACTGSGKTWFFDWTLGTPVKETDTTSINHGKCKPGPYRPDGTYQVGARAADPFGRARQPVSQDVLINRCSPWPVSALAATGRGGTAPGGTQPPEVVDIEWGPPADGDVVGYRVYKGASQASLTPLCPAAPTGVIGVIERRCVDPSPPAYSSTTPYYYAVSAIDKDPSGALREGWISLVDVNTGNRTPSNPTWNTATRTTAGVQLAWNPSSDPDGAPDQVIGYRIYRRPSTASGALQVGERIARKNTTDVCAVGGPCTFVDPGAPAGVTYYVTAIDTRLRESGATGRSVP